MDLLSSPLFYLTAVPGVLLVAISKGGFGGGLAILGVPLLSLALPPAQAAAILLPPLCLMDAVSLRAYRGRWDRASILRMGPAAVLGIAVGTATFRYLSADAIRLLLGAIATLFALNYWIGGAARLAPRAAPGRVVSALLGGLSGFTSFVAHAGGPPVQIALLPQRFDKTTLVGTLTVFFALVNYAKLVPYIGLGLFTREVLIITLVLAPLAPLGAFIGVKLHGKIDDQLFFRVTYLGVFGAGVKLLWDGGRGLLGG